LKIAPKLREEELGIFFYFPGNKWGGGRLPIPRLVKGQKSFWGGESPTTIGFKLGERHRRPSREGKPTEKCRNVHAGGKV